MNFLGLGIFGLLFLETAIFVATVGEIGFFQTFFLWLIAAFGGLWLVRRQGISALAKFTAPHPLTANDLQDGLCLLLAGLLFIFPGFVSDLIGFALLMPMFRSYLRQEFARRSPYRAPNSSGGESGVIEGVYEVVEEEPHKIERKPPAQ